MPWWVGSTASPSGPRRTRRSRARRSAVCPSVAARCATPNDGLTRRITAAGLEALLDQVLARVVRSAGGLGLAVETGLLQRVDALSDRFVLRLAARALPLWAVDPDACLADLERTLASGERVWASADDASIHLSLTVSPRLSDGRTRLLSADGRQLATGPRRDGTLIKALRSAHALAETVMAGAALSSCYERSLIGLSCLAPDIQQAIFAGAQPAELTLQRLITSPLPLDWAEQRRALGFE